MSVQKNTTVTCDRCKQQTSYPVPEPADRFNKWGAITSQANLGGAQAHTWDICQRCFQEFRDWFHSWDPLDQE